MVTGVLEGDPRGTEGLETVVVSLVSCDEGVMGGGGEKASTPSGPLGGELLPGFWFFCPIELEFLLEEEDNDDDDDEDEVTGGADADEEEEEEDDEDDDGIPDAAKGGAPPPLLPAFPPPCRGPRPLPLAS